MKKLHFGCYDYASFLIFIAYAVGSVVFPVVIPDLAKELNFPLESGGMGAAGALHAVRSGAMVVSMIISGFLAARFGLRSTILPGVILMSGAVAGAVVAPSYGFLLMIMIFAGLGEGILEALSTPFVQELHRDDEPGRYVTFSHGFWSVGVALATVGVGVLLSYNCSWRIALTIAALCGVPGIILLILPSRDAQIRLNSAKRQSAGEVICNSGQILKCGRFWFFVAAIFFAGGGEWCLTFWIPTFVRLAHGGSAFAAGVAMALFAFGMMLGRMFSGMWVAERFQFRLLMITGITTCVIGSLLPFAPDVFTVCVLVTLAGISVGPFWPNIQCLCVNELKMDSTLIYILLSCAGIPGCGIFSWLQGAVGDIRWIGLRHSFFLMPLSILIMTVVLALACRRRKSRVTGI